MYFFKLLQGRVPVVTWLTSWSATLFKHQSCYYIHIWTNALRKVMNLLIPTCYGLESTTTALL